MAEARTLLTETERSFVRPASRVPHEPTWLIETRDEALRSFEAAGLPDRKVEAYHYTDLKALLRPPFPPLVNAAVKGVFAVAYKELAKQLRARVVPIVNGLVRDELAAGRDLPDGVEVLPLGAALVAAPEIARLAFETGLSGRENAVRALNTGLARDGLIIRVRAGAAAPLIVLHHSVSLSSRASVHLRHLIVLEEGAEASVLEIFESGGTASLTTVETVVHLAGRAKLAHYKLIKGAEESFHLGRTDARIGADADHRLFVQGAGAGLAREELAARFDGQGGHAGLTGALLIGGERHFDLTARIEHSQPGCTSDMEARAALAGHARGIVQGAVRVAPDAQKSDARQLIRGLLLSPRAALESKPELEILADDVKCSHGAASGDLDADAIFYLRARGIPEAEARALLVEAFLEESFDRIAAETVREMFREEAKGWMSRLSEASDG